MRNADKEMDIETCKKVMMILLIIWSERHQRDCGQQMGWVVLNKDEQAAACHHQVKNVI